MRNKKQLDTVPGIEGVMVMPSLEWVWSSDCLEETIYEITRPQGLL